LSVEEKKSVIITFKKKDKRPDKKKDKLEIFENTIGSGINFRDTGLMTRDNQFPAGVSNVDLGYDINEYDAPILTAALSESEIGELKKNKNISLIEDDGKCFAQNVSYEIEGQPPVSSETIPAGVALIKSHLAWGASKGRGVKVAVLDSGIDYNHPDLTSNFRDGISFVPGQTLMDGYSHGTHCAGTIAAAKNGSGVIGVAPEAFIYGVKVLNNSGEGRWSWLISGINWCISNKMQILNISLGGDVAPAALEIICDTAWSKGLLLIASAGNKGPETDTVTYPAKYKNVIGVSALNGNNKLADFSSRGPEVGLCAPGVNVLSTIPGGRYGQMDGTSMACPHVTGAAALAWGAHRFSDNETIWNLLAEGADNLGIPGWDNNFGYGRVDAEQSTFPFNQPNVYQKKPD